MATAKLMHVTGTKEVVVCDPAIREVPEYELPDGFSVQRDVLGLDVVDRDGVSAGLHADHLGRLCVSTIDSSGSPLRFELKASGN